MASSTQTPQPQVVVLPGDAITSHLPSTKKYKLGLGLERTAGEEVVATCGGLLYHNRGSETWFVLTDGKRYLPQEQDRVVGIVQDRMGSDGAGADLYRVDVGGPHLCTVSSLAFEGATKRNRPFFTPGTLLYARVVSQSSAVVDPVLSCQLGPKDQGIARKDWMTEEAAYGELKGGTVARIPLGLARELLRPQCAVLDELSNLPFEVAIGVNGYLWIHSARPEYTILVRNAVLNSRVLTEEQTRAMVRSLMETVHQQLRRNKRGDEEMDESE